MKIIKIYKIKRAPGVVVITPTPPNDSYVPFGIRLVADKDKAITKDGVNLFTVKDEPFVEDEGTIEEKIAVTVAPWQEVDALEEWKLRDE